MSIQPKKNDLVMFNYIFNAEEKHVGLVCKVRPCFSFETIINILIEEVMHSVPISIIDIEEKHSYD